VTDARTAVLPEVTADAIDAFAERYAKMRVDAEPYRSALVAGTNFEVAGNYAELRTDGHTHTVAFNDVITACLWLGVDSNIVRATIDDLRAELRRTDIA
jgi:hypothetical protein